MTNNERYELALTRVRSGESIGAVVTSLYKNWRHYKKQCSEEHRAEIRAARWQYMTSRGSKTPKGRKRIIFVTTQERDKEIAQHCKSHKMTVSRFVNSAVNAALAKNRNQ